MFIVVLFILVLVEHRSVRKFIFLKWLNAKGEYFVLLQYFYDVFVTNI